MANIFVIGWIFRTGTQVSTLNPDSFTLSGFKAQEVL